MDAVTRRFRRLLADEPVLISAAIRATLIAIGGYAIGMSGQAIAVTMGAVEAWLAVLVRLSVSKRVRSREATARAETVRDIEALVVSPAAARRR